MSNYEFLALLAIRIGLLATKTTLVKEVVRKYFCWLSLWEERLEGV